MRDARPLILLLVSSIFVSAAGGVASAQTTDAGCATPGIDDKCETWIATYDDESIDPAASESPADVVVAPDGRSVYAAMRTTVGTGFDGKSRWAVLAYSDSGSQKWITHWGEPTSYNFPTSIAVAPAGDLVYVSGSWRVDQVAADGHLTTIAFDAKTGEVVWEANYDGPGEGTDNARDLVVSPDGRSLYIAGISAGANNGDLDYAAIEYDARTGEQLWATRWDGIGKNNSDSPFALDLNNRGNMLYLTGWSYGEGEYNNDYGTIAVNTKGPNEGSIAWEARYDGVGVHAPDQASDLVVSPDGSTVFVTGMSNDVDGGPPFDVNYGYATVAYNAETGQQLWEMRKQWPDTTFNSPTALAVDPTGKHLVVSGQAGSRDLGFGTVSYDTGTGAERWADRYDFQDYDLELAKDVVMDPAGGTVYVAGVSSKSPPGVPGLVLYAPNADQLTMAYDLATGEKKWLARFNPSTTDFVSLQEMAISPDARTLYTATSLDDQNWDNDGDDRDAAVTAYEIGPGIPLPPPAQTHVDLTESSDASGEYSDVATLSARLTNSFGDPIDAATLKFIFQGETTSAVTDSQGFAEISSSLWSTPGAHTLRVLYDGEPEIYGPSQSESNFTVEKETTLLNLRVKRGVRSLRAVLRDEDSGEPILARKIVFHVKGKRIGSAITDSNGVAVRSLPKRHLATKRGFTALFKGDALYLKGGAAAR